MLGNHVWRVLDGVARLLVGSGLFQDMGREHVADIVRAVRQESGDGAAVGIGIVMPDGGFLHP